jgi:hypothetical protein
MGGLGLMLVSGTLAFAAVSFAGVASAHEPGAGGPGARFRENLAGQLGISVEELKARGHAARDETIDQAVASGRLTPEQGAALKAREPGEGLRRMRDGARHILGNILEAAAKVIRVSEEELRTSLQQGQSLAEIASAKGITRDQLETSLSSELRTRIQTAQTNGTITAEQASRLLQALDERIDQIIDHAGGQHDGMRRGFMKQGGPMAPGSSATPAP